MYLLIDLLNEIVKIYLVTFKIYMQIFNNAQRYLKYYVIFSLNFIKKLE